MNAAKIVGREPFAVFLPNDLIDATIPCMKSLLAIYEALKCPVFAVQKVPVDRLSTYGNIAFCKLDRRDFQNLKKGPYNPDRVYEVRRLIQKPDHRKQEHLSNLAIIGRYILSPDLFPILQELDPGYEGEVQLTDAMEVLRKNGQKMYAYEFEGTYYDTRSRLGYLKACVNFALKEPELAKGVHEILMSHRK